MGSLCTKEAELNMKRSDYSTVSRKPRKRTFFSSNQDREDDEDRVRSAQKNGDIFGPELHPSAAAIMNRHHDVDTGSNVTSTADLSAGNIAPFSSAEFSASSGTAVSSSTPTAGEGNSESRGGSRPASAQRRPGSALRAAAIAAIAAAGSSGSGGGGSATFGHQNNNSNNSSTLSGNFGAVTSTALSESNKIIPFYTPHLHGVGNSAEGHWSVHKARLRMLHDQGFIEEEPFQAMGSAAGQHKKEQSSSSRRSFASVAAVVNAAAAFMAPLRTRRGGGGGGAEEEGGGGSAVSRSLDFSYLSADSASGHQHAPVDRVEHLKLLLGVLQEHEARVRTRTEAREQVARAAFAGPELVDQTHCSAVRSVTVKSAAPASIDDHDDVFHCAGTPRASATPRNDYSSISSKRKQIPPLTKKNVALYGGGEKFCWVIIRGHVYSVDAWMDSQQAQKKLPRCVEALRRFAGEDCTEEFESVHGPNSEAVELLRPLCLGPIVYC